VCVCVCVQFTVLGWPLCMQPADDFVAAVVLAFDNTGAGDPQKRAQAQLQIQSLKQSPVRVVCCGVQVYWRLSGSCCAQPVLTNHALAHVQDGWQIALQKLSQYAGSPYDMVPFWCSNVLLHISQNRWGILPESDKAAIRAGLMIFVRDVVAVTPLTDGMCTILA